MRCHVKWYFSIIETSSVQEWWDVESSLNYDDTERGYTRLEAATIHMHQLSAISSCTVDLILKSGKIECQLVSLDSTSDFLSDGDSRVRGNHRQAFQRLKSDDNCRSFVPLPVSMTTSSWLSLTKYDYQYLPSVIQKKNNIMTSIRLVPSHTYLPSYQITYLTSNLIT